MDTSTLNPLNQEWQTLHQDYERYDRYSLLIKLVAILSSLITIGLTIHLWIAILFILVLWLQEGIWRTVQARTTERLLALEQLIKRDDQNSAMQFYSDWEATRHGSIGLIKEYMRNALRPTVAYPYIILLGILVIIVMMR
ncbi:MAG: hypothetical protein COB33_003455 [Thiotrichaceae bacterium]|nr:hypothetical protein [Thiotrichaceae bacterium]PCI11090.1 MAG: hypothetical protein COB71_11635 [Thiotrichales bacterium]PCI13909.1 MAG: hypothetical protein COB71_04375 [Thiotrichales bacterium]